MFGPVSAENFVRVWQTSESCREVEQKLGMKRGFATRRAWKLRKKGVPLKKMRVYPSLNLPKLIALAKEFAPDAVRLREIRFPSKKSRR